MELKTNTSGKKQKARKSALKKESFKLCLPKDYHWKTLKALADDFFASDSLNQEDYDIISYITRYRDYDTYEFLSEAWGLQDINGLNKPIDGMNPTISLSLQELRSRYQLAALLKKFSGSDDDELAETHAKTKFILAEAACSSYNRGGYKKLLELENKPLLIYMRRFIHRVIGEMPLGSGILKWAKHGPGANLDTLDTGIVDSLKKYESWPYSVTQDCYPYAKFMIETDQRWIGALQDDYRRRYKIPKHYPLNLEIFWERVLRIVGHNEIRFVPKTRLTKRSIAIEPALNLMLQLAVDGYIRSRLKRFGIDLNSQALNQELARQGSLDASDESLVTIDLSAASDTISLKICELVLPPLWYDFLFQLRSPFGVHKNGEVISYEKMSSMGNGSTFVLESLIFAAAIYAAGELTGLKPQFGKNAAVYGDDLIFSKKITKDVIRALNLCGFDVNENKSFVDGKVRESCGTDWVHGLDIRPIFLRKKPKFTPELFNDYNRIQRLLELHYGLDSESSVTLRLLASWIPTSSANLVGPYSNEDFYGYRHVRFEKKPKHCWKAGLFKFPRLIKRLRSRQSEAFLMRKLMCTLAGDPIIPRPWSINDQEVADSGNRFDIGTRKCPVFRRQISRTGYWCENYSEV